MLCLAILQESCVCLVSCSAMLTLKLLIFLRILFVSLISSLLLKLASNSDHAKMRFGLSPQILKRKYFFSKGISGSTPLWPKVSFSAICWTVSTAIPRFLYREYLIFFINGCRWLLSFTFLDVVIPVHYEKTYKGQIK